MTSEFGLQWSPPTVQNTAGGVRNLRTAVPTEEFWAVWRRSKEGLKSKGYSVSKLVAGGDWQVCHWPVSTIMMIGLSVGPGFAGPSRSLPADAA
jgi:hypothetical protein